MSVAMETVVVRERRNEMHGRGKGMYKHGLCGTRLYSTWRAMKSRCFTKNIPAYKNYGGRGIKVCKDWQEFMNFYKWAINTGYKDNLTIERIDTDGNYEPSNCTWVLKSEQAKNTRRVRKFKIGNEVLTCSQISKRYDINYNSLHSRLKLGWSIYDIITKPVKHKIN